jgi:predicted amidohydrolase
MKIKVAQLVVRRDWRTNQARMLEVLNSAQADEWVVFPEGMLSGYFPDDPTYLPQLDMPSLTAAIAELKQVVMRQRCNCLFGTAWLQDNKWHNSVVALTQAGAQHLHHKVELSELDRRVFAAGSTTSAYSVGALTFGMQACRELLFPQTWSGLKAAGAQIVFHINNAIQPHDALWEHILITRAIEQSIFVCSVNNAAAPQALASYLIAPSGKVLLKTNAQQEQSLSAEINHAEVIADLSLRTDY